MVRGFGLVRGGAPKYAQGILLLGEHRVSNCGVGLKVPYGTGRTFPDRAVIPARGAVAVA
jgi:hypothetical protein